MASASTSRVDRTVAVAELIRNGAKSRSKIARYWSGVGHVLEAGDEHPEDGEEEADGRDPRQSRHQQPPRAEATGAGFGLHAAWCPFGDSAHRGASSSPLNRFDRTRSAMVAMMIVPMVVTIASAAA